MTTDAALDLDAYLARIGFTGTPAPTATALTTLHRAHATAISFENIDVLLGRTPRLAPADLQAKLVRDRRGGYCFEQNLLFALAGADRVHGHPTGRAGEATSSSDPAVDVTSDQGV